MLNDVLITQQNKMLIIAFPPNIMEDIFYDEWDERHISSMSEEYDLSIVMDSIYERLVSFFIEALGRKGITHQTTVPDFKMTSMIKIKTTPSNIHISTASYLTDYHTMLAFFLHAIEMQARTVTSSVDIGSVHDRVKITFEKYSDFISPRAVQITAQLDAKIMTLLKNAANIT